MEDLKPEFEAQGIYIKDIWYTIGKKEAHSGGTATCKEKAVCTECGDSYGSLAPHRYGEDNKCTVCGATLPACEAPTLSVSIKGKIVLSWNAVEGAASYQVYRTTGSNTEFDKIATVTGTTFTDTTAAVGTKYYYKVRAIGTNGSYGAFSHEKAAKYSCSAPALKITTSAGHPKIYWEKVNGAVKYWIYRCTDGVNYKYYDSTTKTSYTNNATTIGTTYYYKVKAVSTDDIASSYSAAKSIQCKPAAPGITITRSGGLGRTVIVLEVYAIGRAVHPVLCCAGNAAPTELRLAARCRDAHGGCGGGDEQALGVAERRGDIFAVHDLDGLDLIIVGRAYISAAVLVAGLGCAVVVLVVCAVRKIGIFYGRADACDVLSRVDGNDLGNFEFRFEFADLAFDERLLVFPAIIRSFSTRFLTDRKIVKAIWITG
mgnify:CR=1 FL=1